MNGRPGTLIVSASLLLVACSGGSGGGSSSPDPSLSQLQTLAHQPPITVSLPFLLTDGTIMLQSDDDADWFRLTPDDTGSYLNGSWSQLASLPAGYEPYAFASSMLADGRLVISGGEYNNNVFTLTNQGAIYDPMTNQWTSLQAPAGWDFIGDSPSVVLADGRFLVGRKLDQQLAALDPASLQWTALASTGKSDFNSEEGWTLMPDGSVLTIDVLNAPHAERYLPDVQQWLDEGNTPVDLHGPPDISSINYGPGGIYTYNPPGEIGPAVLRPDGSVFATGASATGQGHTAIYHPSSNHGSPGSWSAGPDFPNDEAGDSSAVLLPSGNVLVLGNSRTLYEFDGKQLLPKTPLNIQSGGSMLTLPSGEVLIAANPVQIYKPTGTYSPSWAPTLANYPATLTRGSTYTISGTQFNGLSQANGFGDELETSTNYPIVRITNVASGHVFYARTHDHSTMGVATGNATVSTQVDVPASMETGASKLEVVANGIPSVAADVTIN
jgi:hypothetical protein